MSWYSFIIITYPFRRVISHLTGLAFKLRKRRLILVFGMSRSGTTMLGNFLTINQGSLYLHEPVKNLMSIHFERKQPDKEVPFWSVVFSNAQRQFKVHCLVCSALRAVLGAPSTTKTICIKPISLIDCINDSTRLLPMADVIYISRHPCGRIESLIRQRRHHNNYEPVPKEKLTQWGKEWAQTNAHVERLFEQNPDWQWCYFEQLAKRPIDEFYDIYQTLDLDWNDRVRHEISRLTTSDGRKFYEVSRTAEKEADKWRNTLSEEQIDAVR